jgi:hypothetical protein
MMINVHLEMKVPPFNQLVIQTNAKEKSFKFYMLIMDCLMVIIQIIYYDKQISQSFITLDLFNFFKIV